MAGGILTDFLRRLRGAALRGADGLSDAELLELFLTRRDEPAFEALVRRHGPMVWGVCRHLLPDAADAEDAFQATFLVLVRKAASIRRRGRLASWLYGVAYRVAVRARAVAARRRGRERQGAEMLPARPTTDGSGAEWRPALHEEVRRLPEKYRAPLLLCYLQGKTHEQAARELAWPVGTVKGRLARARDLLRGRLTRRGVTVSTGLLAAALSEGLASAAVPPALVRGTVQAAARFAAGGAASPPVLFLTKGVLRTMSLTKFTLTGVAVLGLALAGMAGLFLDPGRAAPVKTEKPRKPAAEAKESPEAVAAARQISTNNLKQIGLALHNYHDVNGSFPPAAVVDKKGKHLLSWRVLILPYIEQNDLFKQFKLDEPWDSAHNKKLLDRMPDIYKPVLKSKAKGKGLTYYQVFVGKDTIFPGAQPVRITDITDGTSNTIMVVEAGKPVPWTKPDDVPFNPKKGLPRLGGLFEDGFYAAFADGSVHFIKRKIDKATLHALITRNGGEVVNVP